MFLAHVSEYNRQVDRLDAVCKVLAKFKYPNFLFASHKYVLLSKCLNVMVERFIEAGEILRKICVEDAKQGCEQLFCRLHEQDYLGAQQQEGSEASSHNCLACNLDEGVNRLHYFLSKLKNDEDIEVEYCFTVFILLIYLEVEKLSTIFKFIGITKAYVDEEWAVLNEIRKWANFIKHPKGFLFTHHPEYIYETDIDQYKSGSTQLIGFEFVHKFYTREDEERSKQIIKEIGNKRNLIVAVPDPRRITTEYVTVCQSFCQKLKENPHFSEILKTHTTIDDY